MGSNPINLTGRFLLEMAALLIMGVWGWNQLAGPGRFLLAIGLPVLAAVLWGTFAVPDDPIRSGKAPVSVPGVIRLLLELIFFGFAVWMLVDLGRLDMALGMGVITAVHYALSYDRLAWLVKQ